MLLKPLSKLIANRCRILIEPFLAIFHLLIQAGQFFLSLLIKDFHNRGLIAVARLHPRICSVIEIGEELVVFVLRDRVIFMVVALTTFHGQPQPNRGGCLHAIDHVLHSQFFRESAAFVTGRMIPIEP